MSAADELRGLEIAALVAGAGLITYRLARGSSEAVAAASSGVDLAEMPGRRLYVSLDGIERTQWKASVALLSAGLFGAGVFVGRLSTSKV